MQKYIINILTIFTCLAIPLSASAQAYDRNWPLGINEFPGAAGYGNVLLRFDNDSARVQASALNMNFESTTAAISDSLGQLLFATNGCYIARANGDTLPGSAGLNPGPLHDWVCPQNGYISHRGAMILPMPGSASRYYVLHMGAEYDPLQKISYGPFYYTLVDMQLDGGKGAVTLKNQILQTGSLDPFSAVRHGNGRDWWIVVPQYASNRYHLFLLTPKGIAAKGMQQIGSEGACPRVGSSVFSPDGRRYARVQNCRTVVMDFDRCSGLFSNPRSFERPMTVFAGGGGAFSPDSKTLYISEQLAILKADLSATTLAPDTLVHSLSTAGTGLNLMQQGPDGHIYLSPPHRAKYYPVLRMKEGSEPEYIRQGLTFPVYSVRSLPHFPHFRLYDLQGSICDTLGINSSVAANEGYASPVEASISPNPFRHSFQLSVKHLAQPQHKQLKVSDLSGRLMLHIRLPAGQDTQLVDATHWPVGAYVWELTLENGAAIRGKAFKTQ